MLLLKLALSTALICGALAEPSYDPSVCKDKGLTPICCRAKYANDKNVKFCTKVDKKEPCKPEKVLLCCKKVTDNFDAGVPGVRDGTGCTQAMKPEDGAGLVDDIFDGLSGLADNL